uniref:Uncharacterized protein n=1 Tax=Arundo donax TaxID=35708 RepID=A0A0A8XPD1_ARUDO
MRESVAWRRRGDGSPERVGRSGSERKGAVARLLGRV